jgi:hypothetical protein
VDTEKKRRLHQLHVDSRNLLEQLSDRIQPHWLESCRRLSQAGEWAELLDELSAGLVKQQVPVTPSERDILAELMARFPQPLEGYAYLGDPEGVLSNLNVC